MSEWESRRAGENEEVGENERIERADERTRGRGGIANVKAIHQMLQWPALNLEHSILRTNFDFALQKSATEFH